MDVEVYTTLINSVGFPIVVCGCLFWFIKMMLNAAVSLLNEFKTSINENTHSIEKLIIRLEGITDVQRSKENR